MSGWFRTTRGEWEAGIRDCTRSLERSPDPLSRSLALCILGFAHREKGDIESAIELIGQAIGEQTTFGYTRNTGMLQVWLSEAHLSAGRLEEARRLVHDALDAGERMGTRLVQAAAQRALGRIAFATEDLVQAETCFGGALARFEAMGARFDVGLTHLLLAELADRCGDPAAAAQHLDGAIELFTELDTPIHLKRARSLRSATEAPSGRSDE